MTRFSSRSARAPAMALRHGGLTRVMLVAALSLTASLNASDVQAETLWQTLKNTHIHNPKLNSERARSLAEGEKINAARSGYFPQISGNADIGYARNGITSYTNTSPRGVGLSATQAIYNPRLGPENDKARAEADAAVAALVSAEQQTLLDATQAFLSVIREQRIISLRMTALSTMRQMQTQAVGRQKEGDLTRTSVDQTRARVAEVEADLAQSRADKADADAFFKMVVGLAPHSPSEPSLAGVPLPRSLNEAIAIAESENPKIAAALQNTRVAQSGVDVARAGYLPTLGAEGSIRRGYEDDNLVGQAGQNATVRLKLSVPIFNGGLTGAQVRQAEKIRDQRSFEADEMRRNVRRAVESAFMQHNGAVLRRAASQKRVEASAAALKGLDIEFQAGNAPLYTVLDGRRELVNAQVALARANYDVTMTAFILLAGMGRFDLERVLTANGNSSVAVLGRRTMKRVIEHEFGENTGAIPKADKRLAAPLPKAAPEAKSENAEIPAARDAKPVAQRSRLFNFGFLNAKRSTQPETSTTVETADAPQAPMAAPQPKARAKLTTADSAPAVDMLAMPGSSLVETSMPQSENPVRRPATRGLLPLLMQQAKQRSTEPADGALSTTSP